MAHQLISGFDPALAAWFSDRFGEPSEVQQQAWPLIREGASCLIAAPTGSGKTLAAFFCALDRLAGLARRAPLQDRVHVLYISPLKALSNDIRKNLEEPLLALNLDLKADSGCDETIRAQVRTGDTPQIERARMRRTPPHILVTTPESLYLLLTSASGRLMLLGVDTVIVDEIHALCGNKRGSHLALSLERLEDLCGKSLIRIGLSATQEPLSAVADFLTGGRLCHLVDTGHQRQRDIALEVPESPLAPMMSGEVWAEVYDRLAQLAQEHRSTLVFVNTRRTAERVAKHLAERLDETQVAAHHGSLAREHRLLAETRLKNGELKVLVATASLELGIDIGDVDLVCQLASPRGISIFLQRVGRSGHGKGRVPKGRLFPLSRDDLVECAALVHAVGQGKLDTLPPSPQALDVLAQQLVAEVAAREWSEQELYELCRRAWPYRDLSRELFDQVLVMVSEGYSTRYGRRGAYIHRDQVQGRLRARRGAALTAVMNGGTIPDQFDYDVILEPDGQRIGSLNEDFAFESLPGDIFQLGNASYRVLRVAQGKVHAEDAHGQPPNIPFWFGEAPGRSDALSRAVSDLRRRMDTELALGFESALDFSIKQLNIKHKEAFQLCQYLGSAQAALGVLPSQENLVLERFFDQVGDPHIVLHSTFGARINRALGLALRKRFCRQFNFELQAAAVEDSLLLSLGPTHSFPLEDVGSYLNSSGVTDVLTQALLDSPLFGTRWRWSATIALAVRRYRSGGRAPAQFQRSEAEDLLALVFPDQLACQENLSGPREIPDHPLVRQTLQDCLHEALDLDGLIRLMSDKESGNINYIVRDLNAPSPLAQEVLSARPYAFLDDAPAEERRALTVRFGESTHAELTGAGRLDPAAVARVLEEVWPDVRDADELHDALLTMGFLTDQELQRGRVEEGWNRWADELVAAGRAELLQVASGEPIWIATERRAQVLTAIGYAEAARDPAEAGAETPEAACVEVLRSRLETVGPVSAQDLARPLGLPELTVQIALAVLQQEGFVFQGRYSGGAVEWCERRLLVRIQRYALARLREEIQPVSAQYFTRFLFRWHGLSTDRREGSAGVVAALQQLEGYAAPAAVWERDILPARVKDFHSQLLDAGQVQAKVVWQRQRMGSTASGAVPALRSAAIYPASRSGMHLWAASVPADQKEGPLAASEQRVLDVLTTRGALYASELRQLAGMLPAQLEEALSHLVVRSLISCDGFAGLRALMRPKTARGGRRLPDLDEAGRWFRLAEQPATGRAQAEWTLIASGLLERYGVVFRALLARESRTLRWTDVHRVLRRMEARGEVRGGRFVSGVVGEQFALPAVVEALRKERSSPVSETDLVIISACDPLNLTGIVGTVERIAAISGHRILYRAGVPVAVRRGKEIRWLTAVEEARRWDWMTRLDHRCYRDSPGGVSHLN